MYARQNGKPLFHDNYIDEGNKFYGCCDWCGKPMYKPPLISKTELAIHHHLSQCGRYCSDMCIIEKNSLFGTMMEELKGLLNEEA